MASDVDSLEISQLRAMALGVRIESQAYVAPTPTPLTRVKGSRKTLDDVAVLELRSNRAKDVSSGRPTQPGLTIPPKIAPTSASQPELPSTIPESSRPRKMSLGSQRSGDTQPLSQWVYDAYVGGNKGVADNTTATSNKPIGLGGGNSAPFTNSQGQTDTGHLDLVGLFDQRSVHSDAEQEDNTGEEIGGLTQINVHAELYPEARRFQQPETPASNNRKRTHDGTFVRHEPVTPCLPVNPFLSGTSGDGGVMALSQVFRNTQAPSSPLNAVLLSDETSERPSPNMYSARRMPSDIQPLSSPAKLTRQGLQRSVTEPHDNYVSLEESQAERDRRLRLQLTSSPLRTGKRMHEVSDDEFEAEESQLRRRRVQKSIDLEACHQLDFVRAKPRLGSSNGARGLEMRNAGRTDHRSFAKSGHRPKSAVNISDDLQLDELDELDGNTSEDETEHEEETRTPEIELPDELCEDNKENLDSRHVQVPRTTTRTPKKLHATLSPRSSPIKYRLGSSPDQDDVDELAADVSGVTAAMAIHGSQAIAVADSQGSQSPNNQVHDRTTGKSRRSEQISSSETRLLVPQSQIQPLPNTSQIDSSMARRFIDESSQPTRRGRTSSQIHSSPSVQRHSSPLQLAYPRKVGLRSDAAKSNLVQPISGQLGSSPPKIPSWGSKITSPDQVQSSSPDQYRSAGKTIVDGLCGEMDHNVVLLPTTKTATTASTPRGPAADIPDNTPDQGATALLSTIPETSSVLRYTAAANPSPRSAAMSILNGLTSTEHTISPSRTIRTQQPSTSSTMFETAVSHQSSTLLRPQLYRRSSEPSRSPQKPTSLMRKTFADIATEPSPPDELGVVDIDVGLFTSEDSEFQALMEGSSPIHPSKKRRRAYNGQVIPVASHHTFSAAMPPTSSPLAFVDEANKNVACEKDKVVEPLVSTKAEKPLEAREPKRRKGVTARLLEKSDTKSVSQKFKPILQSRHPESTSKSVKEDDPEEDESCAEREGQAVSGEVKAVPLKGARITTPDLQATTIVVAPNRVLAHFNGSYAGYYPATCIGVARGEEPKYRIRFDDGTVDVVNGGRVRKLELHVGDSIKLDRPGARGHNYVVLGLRDKQQTPAEATAGSPSASRRARSGNGSKFPVIDIYGHTNVLVRLKQQSIEALSHAEELVPLTIIYLTTTLWNSFKDRIYTYHSPGLLPTSGLHTPLDRPSSPVTPSSRSRRVKSTTKPGPSASNLAAVPQKASNLFDNVVFGITNIDNPDIRKETIQHIQANGGQLLENGFDQLFHIPEVTSTSAPKLTDTDTDSIFHLKTSYTNRGFICLIADKHCRKQNFLQALALGIPCLATRWVRDCTRRRILLPWEPYLLPSGESTFLNAVRARLLPSYTPSTTSLPSIVDQRPNFLHGASVLLVIGKGKEEQMMKAYPFIAYALGASKVSRAEDFEAARKVIAGDEAGGETWDWVCHHDGDRISEKAGRKQTEVMLLGQKMKKGKSRGNMEQDGTGERRTRVVVTEFVIQSLILGQLLDDE